MSDMSGALVIHIRPVLLLGLHGDGDDLLFEPTVLLGFQGLGRPGPADLAFPETKDMAFALRVHFFFFFCVMFQSAP